MSARLFVLLILFPLAAIADALSGVVRAPNGDPIAGATVTIIETGRSAVTDSRGLFTVDVSRGTYALRVSRDGFQSQSVEATTDTTIAVTLRPTMAESIVVSGIRAESKTPVTK